MPDPLARFVAEAPTATALFDREMGYVAASPQWLANRGLAACPVGRSHYEDIRDFPEDWRAAHRRCLAGTVETSDPLRLPAPGGGFRWARWIARPWRREDGAVGGIVIASEDVTDRVEAQARERELARKTALLETTLLNMGEGIGVFDPDRRLIIANDAVVRLLAAPPALVQPGALIEDIARFRAERGDFGEVDVDALAAERIVAFRRRERWGVTARNPDGRIIDTRFNPTPGGGGVVMVSDVTERAGFEAQLAERNALLEATFEAMAEGIVVFGPDLRLRAFNRSAAQLFETPPALNRPGAAFEDVTRFCAQRGDFGDVDVDSFVRARTEQFRAQTPWSRLHAFANGRLVDVRFRPMPDGGGVYVYGDVTERERATAALRASEERLRMVIEEAPDAILLHEPDARRYLAANRAAEVLFGVSRDELIARGPAPFYPSPQPDGLPVPQSIAAGSRRALAGEDIRFERRVRRPSGEERVCRGSVVRLPSQVPLLRVSLVDVTEQRSAEDALRASERHFRMLIEAAPDAVLLFDCDQDRFIAANRSAERLFQVPRAAIVEHGPLRFYAPEQADAHPPAQTFAESNRRALAGEEVTFERGILRPSGEQRAVRITLVRLTTDANLIRMSIIDVTEQKAAEAKLAEVQRDLLTRQEADRQRIARELHDSLGQYLAAVSIKIGILDRMANGDGPLRDGLADLRDLTAAAAEQVSNLAWELRPIALDDIGLEAAVRRLAAEWGRRSGLRFDCHLTLDRRLPAEVETTLYRTLQEAVANVVRHARAKSVGVIVKTSASEAVMVIEDDGAGFDRDDLDRATGRGLMGVRERLAALGGTLEVESAPGRGTTLIVRAPLAAEAPSTGTAEAARS